MREKLLIWAGLGVAILILYFSWLPNPDIGNNWYFPRKLGKLINEYYNVRTAIPFIFLGVITELGIKQAPNIWKKRLFNIIFLLLLVEVAEMGQLFLRNRHFDWADVYWGFAGIILGTIAGASINKVLNWK